MFKLSWRFGLSIQNEGRTEEFPSYPSISLFIRAPLPNEELEMVLNHHKKPFSILLFGLFQLSLLFFTVPGQPRLTQLTFLAVAVWVSYYLMSQTTTGNSAGDLGLGSAFLTQIFIGLDLVLFTGPDRLKNLNDEYSRETKVNVMELPLKERILWAFHIYTNVRGIGWAHEPAHLPNRPLPGTTRRQFMFGRLRSILISGSIQLTCMILSASNPVMNPSPRSAVHPLSEQPLLWRILGMGAFGIAGAAHINIVSCIIAIMMVGAGLSKPERWPDMLGDWRDAWNVQRFWRRFWHQNIRKAVLGCTDFILTRILGVSHSSPNILVKFLRLYVAFTVSGIIHLGGDFMLLGRVSFTGAFMFFFLQAAAITVESVVANVYRKLLQGDRSRSEHLKSKNGKTNGSGATKIGSERKPKLWIRLVGYAWVALWFTFSAKFFVEPLIEKRSFRHDELDLRKFVAFQKAFVL